MEIKQKIVTLLALALLCSTGGVVFLSPALLAIGAALAFVTLGITFWGAWFGRLQ